MSTPTARIAEFLRQWAMMPDKSNDIYGIHADATAEEALLAAADLRAVLDRLDTLVTERYQGGRQIIEAAERARTTRDHHRNGNGSTTNRETIARHDGRASGLLEALAIQNRINT